MYRPAYFLTNKKKIYAVGNKARDLRLPQYIGLEVRNIMRLVVLATSDLVAIALGWHLATNDNRLTFLLSSEWKGSEIDLLFSSFLFLSVLLLSAFQTYGRGDKSRNLINSSKAITLAYLALIPIVWELYGTNHFYQLFWAWLLTL